MVHQLYNRYPLGGNSCPHWVPDNRLNSRGCTHMIVWFSMRILSNRGSSVVRDVVPGFSVSSRNQIWGLQKLKSSDLF